MNYTIFCIGNPKGGDDSIGPFIAKKLTQIKTNELNVINAETVPENFTGTIKKINPDVLIIIDAIDMGLKPGKIRIVPPERIGEMHISTHGIPISVLINYLKKNIKKIILIGIQPSKMSGEISKKAMIASEELIDILIKKELDKLKTLE